MVTKQSVARAVKAWCLENDKIPESLKSKKDAISMSSSLAVAMEILGELDDRPDLKKYAKTRGGVGIERYAHLLPPGLAEQSTDLRDLLDKLPDE